MPGHMPPASQSPRSPSTTRAPSSPFFALTTASIQSGGSPAEFGSSSAGAHDPSSGGRRFASSGLSSSSLMIVMTSTASSRRKPSLHCPAVFKGPIEASNASMVCSSPGPANPALRHAGEHADEILLFFGRVALAPGEPTVHRRGVGDPPGAQRALAFGAHGLARVDDHQVKVVDLQRVLDRGDEAREAGDQVRLLVCHRARAVDHEEEVDLLAPLLAPAVVGDRGAPSGSVELLSAAVVLVLGGRFGILARRHGDPGRRGFGVRLRVASLANRNRRRSPPRASTLSTPRLRLP